MTQPVRAPLIWVRGVREAYDSGLHQGLYNLAGGLFLVQGMLTLFLCDLFAVEGGEVDLETFKEAHVIFVLCPYLRKSFKYFL